MRWIKQLCFCVLLLSLLYSPSVLAGNIPEVESRNSGYVPVEVTEYPELECVYQNEPMFDATKTFQEKKILLEQQEPENVCHDSDTIVVTSKDYNLDSYRIILTHVIVAQPENQVKIGLSNDTFGGERELTSDFAKRTGAVVAINGSYFYYDTGKPIDICAPVVLNDSHVLRSGRTNGSEVCLRFDGSFFSPHPVMPFTSDMLLSMGVVSNLGTADPLLLADGLPMSFPVSVRDFKYPRSAIGVVTPGEYYIITAGKENTYDGGLTYHQLQSIFYHLGCTYARSLDGGGSITLVIDGDLKNVGADGSERPVVDFLAFYEGGE